MKQSLFTISYILLTCGVISFTFYSFNKIKRYFISGTLTTLMSVTCLFALLIANLIEYKFSFESVLNSPYKHFSFLIILSYFIGEYRWRVRLLSLLILPVSLLTMTLATFYDKTHFSNEIITNNTLTYLHVSLLMISFSLLLLSFSSSVIYLLKNSRLKNHSSPLDNFPTLEKIAKMIVIPFNIGWATMTVGILLSIISLKHLDKMNIKLILGAIIWIIYSFYFFYHNIKNSNYIRLAKGTIILFILLIIFFLIADLSQKSTNQISQLLSERYFA